MSARILLADDDSSLRFVLGQALGKEGYAVRATGNVATLAKWVRDGEGEVSETTRTLLRHWFRPEPHDLGRPPSDDELSHKMHVPLKQLARIRGIKQPIPDGMLMSRVDADSNDTAPMITGSVKDQQAWHNFVYNSVGPVDQLILEHTLRLNGKPVKNTSEIAKMIGISPAAVSQRKKKIQELLDSQHSGGAF